MSFFTRELKNLWNYFSTTDEERRAKRAEEMANRARIIEEANKKRVERGEIFPLLKDDTLVQRPSISDNMKPIRDSVESQVIRGFVPIAPPLLPVPDSLHIRPPTEKDTRPVNIAPTNINLTDLQKIKDYESKNGSMNLGFTLGPPKQESSRNDLLESIKQGKTLKPVRISSTRSPEKTLLDDIKSGMILQKPKPLSKPLSKPMSKPKQLSFNEMLLSNPKFKRLSQFKETKDDWETGEGRRKKKPKKVFRKKSLYEYY